VGAAFRRQAVLTTTALVAGLASLMLVSRRPVPVDLPAGVGSASFYAVVPYEVMVTLFGLVFLFVVAALSIGGRRFQRDIRDARGSSGAAAALRDVLTLRHLHATGVDCVSGEEHRSPWRRWFHHLTFYGFMLCVGSTSVAAIYHHVFDRAAPYGYTSLPVLLGTAGGLGLVIGPAGLLALRRRRDPALGVTVQDGLDESFIAVLLLTSVTGLALLVLRDAQAMSTLLIVHLAAVLALFLMLPYGKFVHGLYRTIALLKYSAESRGIS
jgi:citrate/tricarballylate utilization protein